MYLQLQTHHQTNSLNQWVKDLSLKPGHSVDSPYLLQNFVLRSSSSILFIREIECCLKIFVVTVTYYTFGEDVVIPPLLPCFHDWLSLHHRISSYGILLSRPSIGVAFSRTTAILCCAPTAPGHVPWKAQYWHHVVYKCKM